MGCVVQGRTASWCRPAAKCLGTTTSASARRNLFSNELPPAAFHLWDFADIPHRGLTQTRDECGSTRWSLSNANVSEYPYAGQNLGDPHRHCRSLNGFS